MSNIQIILSRDIYQDNVVEPVTLTNPLYVGDNLAQRVRFRVFRRHGDIAPVDMSSLAIRAYFARPDGGRVMMDGVSGKEWSYVDLPAACYAYPGTFDFVIKSVLDTAETTIMRVKGELDKPVTGTIVDPGTDVGNIEEIVEAFLEIDSARNTCVEAAGTSTAAAETATAAAGAASADAQTASEAAASAQESAQAAGDSAANASESETSASGSAAAAAASETNAAGSATEAAGSAADAAASKAAAQAAQNAAQAAQTAAEAAASEEVADWLAAHVNPETGYVLDNTLAIEGAAADAKAAGDAIGDLKNAIKYSSTFGLSRETLPANSFGQGRYNSSGGINQSSSTSYIRTLNYIPTGIKTVSVANGYTMDIHAWDTSVDPNVHINNVRWGVTEETDLSGYPASYRFKIVLNAPAGGEVNWATDYDKISFGYITDKTLSLERIPADAKAVSDLFGDTLHYIRNLTSEDDLDTLSTTGIYWRTGTSVTPLHQPAVSTSYALIVLNRSTITRQIIIGASNMWVRSLSASTPVEWELFARKSNALIANSTIASGTDLNTLTKNEFYSFDTSSVFVNSPSSGKPGNLIVFNPIQTTESATNTANVVQLLIYADGEFYFRRSVSSGWLPWHKLRNENDAPLYRTVDLSNLSKLSYGISNAGKYTTLGTASKGIIVEIPEGAKKFSFIGKYGGYVVVLDSWDPVVGESADLNSMYTGRIGINANGIVEYRINNKAKYIFVLTSNTSGTDLTPSDFRFYFVSTPEMLQELPVLYLSGDTTGMTKDNAVTLDYWFMGNTGTCTVKWQGSSSQRYVKKNYTIKFSNGMDGWALWANYVNSLRSANGNISTVPTDSRWGTQKKFCTKANWIDPSMARNIVCARLWGQIVKSRVTAGDISDNRADAPNYGAIDGFPIEIRINNETAGLYTFNIPKDGWTFNMGEGAAEYVVCGESNYNDASRWRTTALLNGSDYSVEYAPDGVDDATVAASLNTAISAAVSAGANWETELAPYLDIDSVFDYFIFTCCVNNHDAFARNIIYGTYDGVKWFMSAYDLDTTFGVNQYGTNLFDVVNDRAQFAKAAQMHRLAYLIYNYSKAKLKARYQALRSGILSDANVWKELANFIVDIPSRDYDIDRNRWPSMPGTSTANMAQYMDFYRMHCNYLDNEIANL